MRKMRLFRQLHYFANVSIPQVNRHRNNSDIALNVQSMWRYTRVSFKTDGDKEGTLYICATSNQSSITHLLDSQRDAMKTLVILASVLCVALSYPWDLPQPVQDTPEVAAAKSKHLEAHAKARYSSSSWNSLDEGSWKDDTDSSWKHSDDGSWKDDTINYGNHHSAISHHANHDKKWTGPVALSPGYDKHGAPLPVKDTPEVAAAKSKHLAAHANAKHSSSSWEAQDHSWDNHDDGSWKDDTQQSWDHPSAGSHYGNHDKKWTGPVALPPGYDKHGAPLPVKDTPEVAAAKSKHLAAHANAKHSSSSWEAQSHSWDNHDDGSWKDDTQQSWDHQSSDSHYLNHDKKWTGPVALPPGYDKHGAPLPVKDTPEVAAAKSKHLAAHANAKHSSSSWEAQSHSWDNHDDGSWKDDTQQSWDHQSSDSHYLNHDKKWTGPVALPPGYDKHGAPLPVKDTPEVAAAKSKHLAAHANAKHSSSSWEAQSHSWDNHDDGSWKDDTQQSWDHHSAGSLYGNHDKKWTGPVALPPGYDKHGAPLPVKDTPEVAAEKSKHFHLYAHAASKSASSYGSHGWA